VKLSPGQQAYVDQAHADITLLYPWTLRNTRERPDVWSIVQTVIEDCLADEDSIPGRLLAWKEALTP
jgi:hypothetical protein